MSSFEDESTYLGKQLSKCSREELYDCIKHLSDIQREYFSNAKAIALGRLELIRQERKISCKN